MEISEIALNIFRWIDQGSTYKAVLFTCRNWYDLLAGDHEDRVDKYSNHLLTLIKMYPDKSWNWFEVYRNPNTTLAFAKLTNKKSYGPGKDQPITEKDILDNVGIWDWDILSSHPVITWNFVLAHRA